MIFFACSSWELVKKKQTAKKTSNGIKRIAEIIIFSQCRHPDYKIQEYAKNMNEFKSLGSDQSTSEHEYFIS